jgi:hypothetical protein
MTHFVVVDYFRPFHCYDLDSLQAAVGGDGDGAHERERGDVAPGAARHDTEAKSKVEP